MLYASAIVLICSGCDDWREYNVGKTEIEAFYYHEPGRYTAAVLKDSVVKMIRVPDPIIIVDAKDKEWLVCQYRRNSWNGHSDGNCYVHLRSVNSMNTAGWNNGKFGKGTTSRINYEKISDTHKTE